MLISDSRFDLVWFRLSCDHGWIRSGSVNVRKQQLTVVMLGYDWWLCMVIDISVQYSGGLLSDIILLTQVCYQWGTRLNTM